MACYIEARSLSTDPGQAYAVALFGSRIEDLWISFDVRFNAGWIALARAEFGDPGEFAQLLFGPSAQMTSLDLSASDGATVRWLVGESIEGEVGGPVVADIWYHLDWHSQYVASDPAASRYHLAFYVDGVAQSVTPRTFLTDRGADRLLIGVPNFSGAGQDGIADFRNVKVGTTMGAADIFDGTLTTTTLVPPFSGGSAAPPQLVVICGGQEGLLSCVCL